MLNIHLIYLGAPKEDYIRDALNEYEKRLSRSCRVIEKCLKPEMLSASPSAGEIAAALSSEAQKIRDAIPKGAYTAALCVEGKTMSSEAFADLLRDVPVRGYSDVAFIVGSSFGLDEAFKRECDLRLSFSPMTFAHSLFLVMLAEQIYRGFAINSGTRYHK